MLAAINSEEDSAKIEDINKKVTHLLDSFVVSWFEGFVYPTLPTAIVTSIVGEPHRGHYCPETNTQEARSTYPGMFPCKCLLCCH
jgi:hypothetical protein